MAAFGKNQCLLFTDPSVLGITSTGDVDDIAAILFLAQKHGADLCVVICDDDGRRYGPFMDKYGNDIVRCYKCTIVPEASLIASLGELQPNTTVFIHAPVSNEVAIWLEKMEERIFHVYAQGESSGRANFTNAGLMWKVLNGKFLNEEKVHFYASDATSFVIPFDPAYLETLHPKAAQLYSDYFLFQKMKSIGLPVKSVFLADMLFSDTGGPGGGIGNGIRSKVPKINELRKNEVMPPQDNDLLKTQLGRIEAALLNTYKGGNPSTLKNLRDALWLLNQYCDYERLLVSDGMGGFLIPDMSQLRGDLVLKPDCPPDIKAMFEPLFSTPLFDFASAAYAKLVATPPANFSAPKNPPTPDGRDKLIAAVIASLNDFNARLTPPGAAAMVNGGRKTRRRRRKRRKTRR